MQNITENLIIDHCVTELWNLSKLADIRVRKMNLPVCKKIFLIKVNIAHLICLRSNKIFPMNGAELYIIQFI